MRVAVFGKRYQSEHIGQITKMFNLLDQAGAEVYVCENFYSYLTSEMPEPPRVAGLVCGNDFQADCVLSIGGDGTFLKTAHRVGEKQFPILGINTGRLGFLAASDGSRMEEIVRRLMEGRYVVEERNQLCVQVEGHPLDYPYALNEVAITRRDSSAMLHIHVTLNGEYLNDYQADGLLVATATGSTAYTLSVGGPILMPENRSMIMVPIAPHSLTVRPLVLDGSAVVEIQVQSRNSTCLVALDGRNFPISSSEILRVTSAAFPVRIIRGEDQSFVTTLRAKMMWGRDMRSGL